MADLIRSDRAFGAASAGRKYNGLAKRVIAISLVGEHKNPLTAESFQNCQETSVLYVQGHRSRSSRPRRTRTLFVVEAEYKSKAHPIRQGRTKLPEIDPCAGRPIPSVNRRTAHFSQRKLFLRSSTTCCRARFEFRVFSSLCDMAMCRRHPSTDWQRTPMMNGARVLCAMRGTKHETVASPSGSPLDTSH